MNINFEKPTLRRLAPAVLAAVLAVAAVPASGQGGNVAYEDAQVRFTVITGGVVRMEWQPDGRFTDAPSLVAAERHYPEARFKVSKSRSKVEIATDRLRLTYKPGSGRFTAANLAVTNAKGFFPFSWRPGQRQQGNLKGTFRTLDGLDGDVQTQTWVADMKKGQRRGLEDGLLATDGWTLVDDSRGYLFDGSDWQWVAERPDTAGQDWYFMAYGHDYKSALKDFTAFAGKVPLPPRYAFGYWWSRYWCYSDGELRQLVQRLDDYGFPLDVLVVDMDWHYTDQGRGGWTGWTWNRSLFPDPGGFLAYAKGQGLKATINLHPADGFRSYEEQYPLLARDLGVDTAAKPKIPWVNSDKRFMQAVFRDVLHPMERQGVDFWWLDWQQAVYDPVLTRLSNTWWISRCFFTDMERNRDRRPLIYHRWGGLGNHRYQVGFSGDAIMSWNSLAYQPYFTATASNVLYGYWSHDLGGHICLGKGLDPEMYVRWMQWGALSPIMRTHSSKDSRLNKEPWVFDADHCAVLRQTVRQRYAMAPYIYTMARQAYDDGVSLCRPLYYDRPDEPEAYAHRSEYMFGDDVLVAPVATPMSGGFATQEVWLPEGRWYELHTGTLLDGGRTVTRRFALDEYGIYVKAGAVLPGYGDDVRRLDGNDEAVTVTAFPGGDGSFDMYEDAGDDKRYATEYAFTHITSHRTDSAVEVVIGARRGSYAGMPAARRFVVKVPCAMAPLSATVNGRKAATRYLGAELAVVVDLGSTPCDEAKVVRLTFPKGAAVQADGTVGHMRRVARTVERMKYRTGKDPVDALNDMAGMAEAVGYHPATVAGAVERFAGNYGRLPELLRQQGLGEADQKWFMEDCGWQTKQN